MNVRHHPDDLLLLDYATGTLDPALTLIVATHLCLCTQCQAQVALSEEVGGALLEDITPVPLEADALASVMARLEAPQESVRPPASNDNTPVPLRAFLGRDLTDVRWRKMGPRLGYTTLYRRGPLAMRLLRGAPGAEVGPHTHRGLEYTLVLRGGFSDETGSYGPGDFQAASDAVIHNPVADAGEDCINLSVTTDRLRFRSRVQDLVAGLFGF